MILLYYMVKFKNFSFFSGSFLSNWIDTLSCAGLGLGFPGLQFGFGIGSGCGIGLGFGYGMGKGIAYDENQRYTNVGKLFQGTKNLPAQDHIGALVDGLVVNTKKLIEATSRGIEKWR
ncbi:uncharacterized protein LOC103720830 isoform X2 [Phoenix dactylifera]|uniref:Uncharacterized protein LOC103720830 isoform X2 n=1 Tax=Phoenix dactylifera TaxID=42345 RepID=A0A8B9ARX7_PHODC|nr:uncharacterized protein LOC103720830 isoform X2 [Phoenix dactylifera]